MPDTPALAHVPGHTRTRTHAHTHTPKGRQPFKISATCVPARKPGVWFPDSHSCPPRLTDADPGKGAEPWGLPSALGAGTSYPQSMPDPPCIVPIAHRDTLQIPSLCAPLVKAELRVLDQRAPIPSCLVHLAWPVPEMKTGPVRKLPALRSSRDAPVPKPQPPAPGLTYHLV